MDVLSTILGPITEYLLEPIARQFGHLLNYKTNIANLETEVAKLRSIRNDVQKMIVVDRRNIQTITFHVQEWMAQVERTISDAERILDKKDSVEKGCLNYWFPNLKLRFSLSRRAKNKTDEINKLRDEGKPYYGSISYPADPDDFRHIPFGKAEFESRKSIEDKIIAAFKDVEVKMIGLSGMGGVGKTTMAKSISKRVIEEKIFKEVVIAVVSHTPEKLKIQSEIADGLGLTLREESLSLRAGRLRTRIMDAKKLLIILDDVWKWLDLYELGIPSLSTHECCSKILLTSRHRDVCNAMEAEKVFTVPVLSEVEAWMLFKENAGNSIEDPQLIPIATHVASECKGLPIALVTVGRSLRNKRKRFWEDAHVQLKRALPASIPEMISDVYRPLELSYTNLGSDEARAVFLMCCLFPEDAYIPIDALARYGMGLGIFSGVENLKEERDRVYGLVEMLKDRSLLVDNGEEIYVQMHDVIRDVALSIASRDKHVFLVSHNINTDIWPRRSSYEQFTGISVISGALKGLPERLDCPKLEILLLECNQVAFKAADGFFSGMRALKVLEMQDFYIPSLPKSIKSLTSLRTLQLRCCEFVKKISDVEEDTSEEILSMIAELVNLEVLSFGYSSIKVLPTAVGKLRNLRMLDLIGCTELDIIQPSAISGLVQLEELSLKSSFTNWEAEIEGKERHNASLVELESLPNLTSLEIQVPEVQQIPLNLHFSSLLTKYEVLVGQPSEMAKEVPKEVRRHFQKIMCFQLPFQHSFGGSFLDMLRNTEYLYSRGDGSNSAIEVLSPDGFQNLKQLHLDSCSSLRNLGNTEDQVPPRNGVFPLLEKLHLGAVSYLKELCHGQLPAGSLAKLKHLDLRQLPKLIHLTKAHSQQISLSNLVSVCIDQCDGLQNLFTPPTARSLLQLQQLKVSNCRMMEEVISEEGAQSEIVNKISEVKFPKLNYVGLDTLEGFTGFCKLIDSLQLPELNHLRINSLPKLKSFSSSVNSFTSGENQDTGVQSLFDQKIALLRLKMLEICQLASVADIWSRKLATGSFSELEELKLTSCHGLKNMLSSSVAKGLVNLKELEIRDCSMMEEIIKKDEEEEQSEGTTKLSLFPQLEMMKLLMLQNLKSFCQLKQDIEMELLRYVEIRNCPELRTFNPGSLTTPSLKVLKVDDREIEIKDVNVIQKTFQAKQDAIQSKNNYFLLPARDLTISQGDDTRHWNWLTMKESSDESFVVAELLKVTLLDIRGRLGIMDLSPGISYEIAFVIMLREPTKGLEEPVNLRLRLPNGSVIDRTESLKAKPRGRWIEIPVGEIKASQHETEPIHFALVQHNTRLVKRGLVIKGVILRPRPSAFEESRGS